MVVYILLYFSYVEAPEASVAEPVSLDPSDLQSLYP